MFNKRVDLNAIAREAQAARDAQLARELKRLAQADSPEVDDYLALQRQREEIAAVDEAERKLAVATERTVEQARAVARSGWISASCVVLAIATIGFDGALRSLAAFSLVVALTMPLAAGGLIAPHLFGSADVTVSMYAPHTRAVIAKARRNVWTGTALVLVSCIAAVAMLSTIGAR